jgi:hypothetical protein
MADLAWSIQTIPTFGHQRMACLDAKKLSTTISHIGKAPDDCSVHRAIFSVHIETGTYFGKTAVSSIASL